jgi:GntR family transcriptional regulator
MFADVFTEGVIALATDDEQDKTPAYAQIVGDLRTAILGGTYKYDDRLPTEAALMDSYNCSRPTAHRALSELEFEGLVELQRGLGTFVRYLAPILRKVGERMSADVWGAGKSVWEMETDGRNYSTDSGSSTRGPAPEQPAGLLGTDDAWIRERRHLVDGCPVMLSVSYYPADVVAASRIEESDTGPGGSPARLAELGHAPKRHRERFFNRQPSADERRRLQLPRGTRVVDILRVSKDAEDRVVEVTEMVANSNVFVFQVDYTS